MVECNICESSINENKDSYKTTTVVIDGEFDDIYTVHTKCRIEKSG